MTHKEKYKLHCSNNEDIPIFLTYDWIDAVSKNGEWDVVIKEAGDSIQGFIVYYHKTKLGQKYITMPHFTPYSGLWINYPEGQKNTTRISFERKVMEELILQLPKVDFCVLHLYPSITNWQPFYWNEYKQTSRYTYIIDRNKKEEDAYNNLRDNIRREIKKAEKSITIDVIQDISILKELKDVSITKTEKPLSYYIDHLISFYDKFSSNFEIIVAKKEDKIIAASIFIKDKSSTYYLLGMTLTDHKTSGALSLLLWTAIKKSINSNRDFNFEGSMIKPIERFFSSFGAEQIPYHRITKSNSLTAKTKELIKGL